MTAVAGLLIVLGLAGVVVPVIPGLLLVWAGVFVWFLDDLPKGPTGKILKREIETPAAV